MEDALFTWLYRVGGGSGQTSAHLKQRLGAGQTTDYLSITYSGAGGGQEVVGVLLFVGRLVEFKTSVKCTVSVCHFEPKGRHIKVHKI